MTPRICVLLLAGWMVSSLSGLAQEPTASSAPDPKALLAQSLAAAGATNVNAFTASGTITYFWAGEPVQGAATLRGRGAAERTSSGSMRTFRAALVRSPSAVAWASARAPTGS